MKPVLAIGLGNPLMGDEGIGWHIAERLAADPRLPEHVEVICGGTDLIRYAGEMDGRSRVVLIDAIEDGSDTGTVTVFDRDFSGLEEHQEHAHHLSAIEAVGLLRLIASTSFTFLGISIASARFEPALSPSMAARMPAILQEVLENLL
ncbi:MAG: hydrogenase maturation protease [Acidobacteriia bacterium]|nr:hydrogenase maturation protease [Terriglobia bacterium]